MPTEEYEQPDKPQGCPEGQGCPLGIALDSPRIELGQPCPNRACPLGMNDG